MKVLLVRPPVAKHTIGLKHIMICEPLELEYLAACLNDHDIVIFDSLVERGFKKRFHDFAPDVVVSSCYKTGTNEVIKLFRTVKSLNRNCYTIVGGVHATLVPEDFTDEAVDIIGIGDGTYLLADIIHNLEHGGELNSISGIGVPIGEGILLKTPKASYMENINELPLPRRDLVKHLLNKYYYLMHQPVATIKTTWGCWYDCNFCCTWKITDGISYSRSPESIVEELMTIEAEEVYIVDDIFLINRSRLNSIAALIKKHNIKKNYLCYARADFIVENADLIEEWATLGLKAVFVGLEAVTDIELDLMNKKSPAHYNKKAIEILRHNKIETYGSLIPGADYQKKDWRRLWKFIEESKLYYVNISPATPLPGADNYKSLQGKLKVPADAHGLFDLSHQLLPTNLPLKSYYRELLWLYVRTVLDINRARKYTFRTLPTIWSRKYWRMIWGSIRIGFQFFNAHTHHSSREIKIAQDKGPKVIGLNYNDKFRRPSFKSFNRKKEIDLLPILE